MENRSHTFQHMYQHIQYKSPPIHQKCHKCQKQYKLNITSNLINYSCENYTINITPDQVIIQQCSQCKKSVCFQCFENSYWIQESEYFNISIHNQTKLTNPYQEGFNESDTIYFACSQKCFEIISNILD